MKNFSKLTIAISLFFLSSSLLAWSFADLWQTADQQGATLLRANKAEEASKVFINKDWKAVATYRSGNYASAYQQFSGTKTSDGQYNAGNAAAYLGQYQKAIDSYDKAIALNPNNTDAINNRELIKKLMDEKKQSEKKPSKNAEKDNNTQDKNNVKNTEKKDQQQDQSKQKNLSQKEQDKLNPMPENQQSNSTQQNEANASPLENQNQDKKQLLRRLADNPGGLLRQKFRRDYLRRHVVIDNKDQGEV